MIKSMTGFGKSDGSYAGVAIQVEVRSINSRYFDFAAKIPSQLFQFETGFKKLVQGAISRGKVSLYINLAEKQKAVQFSFDEARARKYVRLLKEFAKKEHMSTDVTISDIMQFPEVFQTKSPEYDVDIMRLRIERLIKRALVAHGAMRTKEGKALETDLSQRLTLIDKKRTMIAAEAMREPSRVRDRIKLRLQGLDIDINKDTERLAKEAAYVADRCDITEEIVRLKSHCVLFRKSMKVLGMGKKYDFILQEMHREVNTIGSKTQNKKIAQAVIDLKLEVEKMREQVQNIE